MKFIALVVILAFCSISFTNANPTRLIDNVNIVVDGESNRYNPSTTVSYSYNETHRYNASTPVPHRFNETHRFNHSTPVSHRFNETHRFNHSTPVSHRFNETHRFNHSTPALNNNGTHRFNHSTPVSHRFNETHRFNHSTPALNNNGTHRFNHSTPVSHRFNETHRFNHSTPSSHGRYEAHRYNYSVPVYHNYNQTKSNMTQVDISALPTINEVKSLLSELRTIKSSLESKLNDLSAFTNNGTEIHRNPHYHTEKEEIKVTETKRRTEKKGDSVITEDFETKKHINREKNWDE